MGFRIIEDASPRHWALPTPISPMGNCRYSDIAVFFISSSQKSSLQLRVAWQTTNSERPGTGPMMLARSHGVNAGSKTSWKNSYCRWGGHYETKSLLDTNYRMDGLTGGRWVALRLTRLDSDSRNAGWKLAAKYDEMFARNPSQKLQFSL